MKSWIDYPAVLFSMDLPLLQSVNSVARIYLIVGLVWSLISRSVIPLGIMFVMALLMTLVIEQLQSKKSTYSIATTYLPQPGPVATQQSYSDYDNPMPFGDYKPAVTSSAPRIQLHKDDALRRLYSQPDETPLGLYMNPIPDPTLMARPPVFSHSSEVDRNIVQDQGNMRYIR